MQTKISTSLNLKSLNSQKEIKYKQNVIISDKLSAHQNQQEEKCLICLQYVKILQANIKKYKSLAKSQKKLKRIIKRLQQQNSLIVETTDNAIRQFKCHIKKLEHQIIERDQVIAKLAEQIEYINISSESLSQLLSEQKQKMRQIQVIHNEQIYLKNNEINDLKTHILKQITQKAGNQRRYKEQTRKWSFQQYKLKQQIKILNQQIQQKQRLIKLFSDSNNQLRVNLIQLKSRTQIQDLTWVTDKKRSFMSQTLDNYSQLKRQNQKLKVINQSLQYELKFLINQSQQAQNILFKTKLQRDVFQKNLQKLDLEDFNVRKGYGSIHHNYPNKRKAYRNLSELAKLDRTIQQTIKTSSNSIQVHGQEDFPQI